ncbi:TPA: hypothetical protein SHW33_002871 [Clostridioides difficile]|uniref:hypothetical protein n=1 Tax=Clostridioides difficile TaxID=1496 RepID=UPI00016C627F|nr:hypothetical protein [Clostridioides difficile]EGT4183896.1 hypothetical protein [Clostridioides difficile]EGT4214795.1 hypothetical protein [Clostridioides difficile]EGT4628452.1 hypothetical protein [Clostridioides difficile]EJA6621407.1 hypothetical protein [Clostridioides difficile]EJA6785262.1 hypothetical protein [Clostridioides difficile]
MEFNNFKKQVQERFNKMTTGISYIYEVDLDKDRLWNLYLDSFPEGTNEIFRERREYDCSCCRQFIKNIGNVVTIKDNKISSIWDIDTDCPTFKPVVKALSEYVKSHNINDIYVSKFKKIGTDKNFENTSEKVYEWNHLYIELPDRFVDETNKSVGDIKGRIRDVKNVFKRSLDEISEDSVSIVLDLINQKSLYKGEEWQNPLIEFLKYKRNYIKLQTETDKQNFAWEQSVKAGVVIGKIRNHSIGTLLLDISEGVELDKAVSRYEKIVAPSNYKRPKAIYTKKMLDEAKKTITELGYMDSLQRRHATIDDITVNNILFVNKDSAKQMGEFDIFDEMSKGIGIDSKKFSKVEELNIEEFIQNVLPTSKEVELLLENRHIDNFVSLIAPVNKEAKSMLKWDNNFGWAYAGNMTDSSMKENVKNAGGKVDGVLRFSIQWNDTEFDNNDLDAHCIEPNGNHIYFGNKTNYSTTGMLDIDIMHPKRGNVAVENITWSDINKMRLGTYKFYVNNYSKRSGISGFRAEIEFNGEIYSFDYNKPLRDGENVMVAEVTLDIGNRFKIKPLLPSNVSNKEIWGLTTNQFIPVSVIMNSPNYWDGQQGIGNKHYFFMLKDCINEETVNGFYNEYLKNDLNVHRKVFEALGSKMYVPFSENQMSGLGFSSTRRNEVIVKVRGSYERILKIKF